MAVAQGTDSIVKYTGNGSTDTFAITFPTFDDTDIEVQVEEIATGLLTDLSQGTDYTLDDVGIPNTNASLTLVDASQAWVDGDGDLITGYRLIIRFSEEAYQSTNLQSLGRFSAASFGNALDRTVMFIKSLLTKLNRMPIISYKDIDAGFNPELPVVEASKFIKINNDGDGFEYAEASLNNIDNASISNTANIARSKLASGTASHVLINDGSGVMSSEATLAKSRGGAGASMTSVTFPSTGTIATLAGVEALTNKDIDGGTASNTSRITVPKAATATLSALTRKQGTIVYDTTTNRLFADNGSSLQSLNGLNVTSKTTTYVATVADDVILCDGSGGSFVVTLPPCSGLAGKVFMFKRTDTTFTNSVTIAADSESIDGFGYKLLYTQNETIRIVCDGLNWYVLDRYFYGPWQTGGVLTITGTTTNPTKGTTSRDSSWWRRVGDSIELRMEYLQTAAGANGSGDYLIALPTGLQIALSRVAEYSAVEGAGVWLVPNCVGTCLLGNGTANAVGGVFVHDATTIRLATVNTAPGAGVLGSAYFSLGTTNISISANMTLPISGWDA